MEYTVVIEELPSRFIEEVNDLIKDGWRPQGGVAVMVNKNGEGYQFQAMVR